MLALESYLTKACHETFPDYIIVQSERGDVACVKMPYFLEVCNETCRKWSLGIDAGSEYVYFGFLHQGAELFSTECRKMGVLSVFKGF